MSSHGKNTALRVLLDEAEMSNSGLANAVVASGAREGIHLGTGTTSVKRMLDGSQPRWPRPETGRGGAVPAAAPPGQCHRVRVRRPHTR